MASKASNKDIIICKDNQQIRITKRTVSFENHVYQFRNIVGFSDWKIPTRAIIPWTIIFICIISFAVLDYINIPLGILPFSKIRYTTQTIGVLCLIIAIFGTLINRMISSKYGLSLILNSGHEHRFVTSDSNNLKKVIKQLHMFMETDQDGEYVVNVNNNSINIQGNLTGVAAAGNQECKISSDIKQ